MRLAFLLPLVAVSCGAGARAAPPVPPPSAPRAVTVVLDGTARTEVLAPGRALRAERRNDFAYAGSVELECSGPPRVREETLRVGPRVEVLLDAAGGEVSCTLAWSEVLHPVRYLRYPRPEGPRPSLDLPVVAATSISGRFSGAFSLAVPPPDRGTDPPLSLSSPGAPAVLRVSLVAEEGRRKVFVLPAARGAEVAWTFDHRYLGDFDVEVAQSRMLFRMLPFVRTTGFRAVLGRRRGRPGLAWESSFLLRYDDFSTTVLQVPVLLVERPVVERRRGFHPLDAPSERVPVGRLEGPCEFFLRVERAVL